MLHFDNSLKFNQPLSHFFDLLFWRASAAYGTLALDGHSDFMVQGLVIILYKIINDRYIR